MANWLLIYGIWSRIVGRSGHTTYRHDECEQMPVLVPLHIIAEPSEHNLGVLDHIENTLITSGVIKL